MDGRIYAPFSGTVKVTFPTRHAIGLVSDQGIATLIHIGIGTVNMRGTGFIQYVEQDQKVEKGDLLIEFWQPAIKKAGYDDTVIVVVTDEQAQVELQTQSGKVEHGDEVAKVKSVNQGA